MLLVTAIEIDYHSGFKPYNLMRTVLYYMIYATSALRSSENLDFSAHHNHTCDSLAKFINIIGPDTQPNCPLVCKNTGVLQISAVGIL